MFDKTFFKFLFGFLLILLASFALLFFANFLKQDRDMDTAPLRAGDHSVSHSNQ